MTLSGIIATPVTCVIQVAAVPLRAGPRNRTRPSGVRRPASELPDMRAPLPDEVADDPGDDGEAQAEHRRRPSHVVADRLLEAPTGVPDEVANPAEEMGEERPGEAEQD